jgi:hypothetical protein
MPQQATKHPPVGIAMRSSGDGELQMACDSSW